ncbi:MAG: hypothetical protein K2N87_01900 [Eubacterium sp.]|nr:hypothetical protein [Eubacterium sp.]
MKDRKKGAAGALFCTLLIFALCGGALLYGANTPAGEKAGHTEYVMDTRNMYQDILYGKAQFIYVSDQNTTEPADIGTVPEIFSPDSDFAKVWRFAVLDLDGDGTEEMVLQVTDVGGDQGGYMTLHPQDGKVYGFASHYRMYMNLKSDATFGYANLALTEQGIGKISRFTKTDCCIEPLVRETSADGWMTAACFQGNAKISEEAYYKEKEMQGKKADAVWYEFSEDGMEQAFGAAHDIQIGASTETSQDEGILRYSFPIQVSDGQELLVKLYTKPEQPGQEKLDNEPEPDQCFAVSQIRIYSGKQQIQTIDPASLPPVEEYAWDGLFVNQGYAVGEPDVRDLNFDGAQDFGLLTVSAYPKNVPYSYFLWNQEKQQFDYGFTLFGSKALEVDEENRRLVEYSYDVSGEYKDFYGYTADGRLCRQE